MSTIKVNKIENTSTTAGGVSINNQGNVGIGTTSPSTELHVAASSGFAELRLAGASGSGASVEFYNAATQLGDIFIDVSNNMIFRNPSEAFRVDSSRRLLVGTSTSPSVGQGQYSKLVALGGAGTAYGNVSFGHTSDYTGLTNGDNIALICFTDSTGNVFSRIDCAVDATPGGGDYPGRLVFSTTSDSGSTPSERMRIKSTGQIQYQIATAGYLLNADSGAGATTWQFGPSSSAVGGNAFWVINGAGNGVYIGNGDTSWSSTSDERLKQNLLPITDGLDKIGQLRAFTGEYVSDKQGVRRSFLIAQDVLAVLPEAVNTENPDALGLRYTEVIPLLVAALKESKERIETLEAKVAALEAS